MSIKSLILNTLEPIGVPVDSHFYSGTGSTYITFFEVVDVPAMHADDELKDTAKSIQVDIWSTGNFETVVSDVKNLMEEAGFLWNSTREIYEKETKKFRCILEYKKNIKVSD